MKYSLRILASCLFAAITFDRTAHADFVEAILGPITPVYNDTYVWPGAFVGSSPDMPAGSTSRYTTGWFPDSAFPSIWGGAAEPNLTLSW